MKNLLIICVLCIPLPVRAQTIRDQAWVATTLEDRQTAISDVLLARLMVSEGGWDGIIDHAAIAWSITRWMEILSRARPRITLDGAIMNYASGFRNPRTDRQRWIMSLDASGQRPRGLTWSWVRPRRGSVLYPTRSDAWKAALARARAHIRGELPNPCDEVPNHWGSVRHASDRAIAIRALSRGRWAQVRCPGTGNGFYRTVPMRRRRHFLRDLRGRRVRLVRPGQT